MNDSPDSERPEGAPAGHGFFAWLRDLDIVRGSDRWLAGVAGGLAARTGIDPLIVRGIFIVLALLGGPGVLLYLAGWLLLPDSSGRIHLEDIFRGRASAGVVTAAIVIGALVVIPAAFGTAFAGVPLLGISGPWGWDIWSAVNIPGWIPRTAAWLFWIAIIVFGLLWLRKATLNRGRSQAQQQHQTQQQAQQHNQSSAGAGPHSGTESTEAATGSYPAQPNGAAFAATTDGSGTEPLGTPGSAHPTAEQDTRSFTERTDDFARRAADGAAAWGERVGEKATRWGDEVGRQADEWSARYAQHHDAHRMGAAQAVLTLALALLAAGGTALWVMGLDTPPQVSSVAPAPLLAAIIAALAVLAVSLIVAGVRGRHTGWVGFLAACGVFALLLTVVLPWGTRFHPFGTAHVDGLSPAGTVVLVGTTNVDLRDLDDLPEEPKDLEIWMLAGTTSIQLPEHRPTAVRVRVLAGTVEEDASGRDTPRLSGLFLSHDTGNTAATNSDAFADESTAHVKVYLLAGTVNIEGSGTTADRLAERSTAERDRLSDQSRRDLAEQQAADREQLAEARQSLDRVEWQLQEPGLSATERRQLEQQRKDLLNTVNDLEQEMAR